MAVTVSVKRKLVFLDVVLPDKVYPFEFNINNSDDSGKSDLQVVVEHVQRKKPCLVNWFDEGSFDFQMESETRPGKWVSVGENSPLKNENSLKCLFMTKPNTGHQNSTSEPSENSNKGFNVELFCNGSRIPVPKNNLNGTETDNATGIVVRKGPVQTVEELSAIMKLAAGTSYSSIESSSSEEDPLQLSDCSGYGSFLASSPITTIHAAGTAILQNSTSPVRSDRSDCSLTGSQGSSSTSSPSLTDPSFHVQPLNSNSSSSSGLSIRQQVKSVRIEHVRLKPGQVQFPNFPCHLKKKMNEGTPLGEKEYSEVCRELARPIAVHTLRAHPDHYAEQVATLLKRYPKLTIKDGETKDTADYLILKLQRIFEYKRRVAGDRFNSNGGRPRKADDDSKGPGNILNEEDELDKFDSVSYEANVNKMLELSRNFGSTLSLRALWQATFTGRRHEVLHGKVTGIDHLLKTRCPILNQEEFIRAEMNLIIANEHEPGQDIIKKMSERWKETADDVVTVALESSDANVKKIIGHFNVKDSNFWSDEQFETRSRLALEVLPIFLPGTKKGLNSSYLYDAREDSAELSQLLKKPKRLCPFIVSIGNTFHVIADQQPFLTPKNSIEALIDILCVFYVFHIKYGKEIKPALLFLQSQVLGLEDGETKKNKTLGIFMKILKASQAKKKMIQQDNPEKES